MCIRKLLFAGGVYNGEKDSYDLNSKVAIVTGCSKGSLGEATAKLLLENGINSVVITTRNLENSQLIAREIDNVRCFGQHLDLQDDESIQEFVNWFESKFDRLDILINNAGIHLDLYSKWKKPKLTKKGFEAQWHTNYIGTTKLTLQLLNSLKSGSVKNGGDSRIVNVISMLHSLGKKSTLLETFTNRGVIEPYGSWKAYGQSKLGILMFSKELNRRLTEKGITVNCLHPGAVKTNVAGKGLETAPKCMQVIRKWLSSVEAYFLKTPAEGAQTTLHCALAPSLRGVGGLYFKDCKQKTSSKDSYDKEIACKLYEKTIAILA